MGVASFGGEFVALPVVGMLVGAAALATPQGRSDLPRVTLGPLWAALIAAAIGIVAVWATFALAGEPTIIRM